MKATLRRQIHAPVAEPSCSPGSRPTSLWTQLQFCLSTVLPPDLSIHRSSRNHTHLQPNNRPADHGPDCRPVAACDPVSAQLNYNPRDSPVIPGILKEQHLSEPMVTGLLTLEPTEDPKHPGNLLPALLARTMVAFPLVQEHGRKDVQLSKSGRGECPFKCRPMQDCKNHAE